MVSRHFVLIPDDDDERVRTVPAESESTLPQLQRLVGGLIEICTARALSGDLCLVANEEGPRDALPVNLRASRLHGYPGIVGPVVVAQLTRAHAVGLAEPHLRRSQRLTARIEQEATGGYWRIESESPAPPPPNVIDLSEPPMFMVLAHRQVQGEALNILFGGGPATQRNRRVGDRVLHPSAVTPSGDRLRGTVVRARSDWLSIRYDNGGRESGIPPWWPTLVLPDCIDLAADQPLSEVTRTDVHTRMLARLERVEGDPLGLYRAAASLFAAAIPTKAGETLMVRAPWDSTGQRLSAEVSGWRVEGVKVKRGALGRVPPRCETGRLPPEQGLDRSP